VDQIAMCQRTLEGAERLIASLRPEELSQPSPCSEWNVRQVIDHMIGVNYAFARGASGQPLAGAPEAGASPSGDDPATAYSASARAALAAWRSPGALERTLNMPFGQVPGAQAIGFNITDQLMHTWDLAKATGRDRTLDPDVAAAMLERARQTLRPEMRGAGRPFGPEQPCPADAPIHDRLAAFFGRAV
jgi:uncharacterized protein (TIGR03086 family)